MTRSNPHNPEQSGLVLIAFLRTMWYNLLVNDLAWRNGMEKSELIIGLKRLIERLQNDVSPAYRNSGFSFGNERFEKWKNQVRKFLDENLPNEKIRFEKSVKFYGLVSLPNETEEQDFWRNHGNRAKAYIDSLIMDIQNDEYESPDINMTKTKKESSDMDNKKIFIVHGRNEAIRDKVEAFVRRIGLEPVILCQEASRGQSILEKIISHSDVGFALVLYTGCDEGRLRGSKEVYKPRARQNVVFEHGYMIAHLSKDRVVALIEDDSVEIPGDYAGVVYISLSDSDWETQVKRELHAAGIEYNPYV